MAALVLAGAAFAQPYPSKAVKVIVPFGAGGPTDVIARVVAQKLSEAWGQQVVTENIPGAGGNTGVAMAARAPADGYTMRGGEHRLHGQSEHVLEDPLRPGQGLSRRSPWWRPRPT